AVVTRGEKEDACLAVSTALKMLEKLQQLNVGWKERSLPALRIGLGLNYGQVVCAHLGAQDRYEYTAIGDQVNLASRLEGATKALHLEMLIGETMAPLVGERFILRTADLLKVVGKTRPVEVFTVLGERKDTPEPEWLAKYEEGVRLYRERKFNDAKHALEAADAKNPDDWMIREYLRRCRTFLVMPPGPEWDGVFVMEKK
ncbi:MAG TPA: adenylate/guanylate cyclase domain-containing protein, partial [Chthoniobacteraceae bacterium]